MTTMFPLPKLREKGNFQEIVASHSPYLAAIMRRYPELTSEILERDADELFKKYCENPDNLRFTKQKIALLTAISDLRGTWDLNQVTQSLTHFADISVQVALEQAFNGEYNGLFVIAMGKMGAGELNYSSDIDLIIFYDRENNLDNHELHYFERKVKTFVKILAERTHEGYVHRVDLRLRPDPSSTPIVISTREAHDYYQTRGQTWERSAFIKARIVAGDINAGEKFLKQLQSSFVYRKYLDLASLAEIHEMTEAIRAVKGLSEIDIAGHNLKLGRGGIRAIEFFVQAQQLIEGGRDPQKRAIKTLDALDLFRAPHLKAPYIFLRTLEHRLQMINDEQTHSLPKQSDDLTNFARFSGFSTYKSFEKSLLKTFEIVEEAYQKIFVQPKFEVLPQDLNATDLKKLGFKQAEKALSIVHAWQNTLKSARLKEELMPLIPRLLQSFAREGEADEALITFDGLIARARHPLDLVALLKRDPQIPTIFSKILASSPRLTLAIKQRPHVLGGLFETALVNKSLTIEELETRLKASLSLSTSREETLDRMRIFLQEQQFLISLRVIMSQLKVSEASIQFTALADILIKANHTETLDFIHQAHGEIFDEQTAILAMGKCGSCEMTASSDLDLIILYEGEGVSQGVRPLQAVHYFGRFTQKLIANLTAKTSEGGLYEADLRLRPNGNSGQIATSLEAFYDYQMKQAWTWELMALTKARVVSSSTKFKERIEQSIKSILTTKREASVIRKDILEMRGLIAKEKGEKKPLDLKNASGGLTDIEFIAQSLQLINAHKYPELLQRNTRDILEVARDFKLISSDHADILLSSLKIQSNLLQILRLSHENDEKIPKALQKIIAKIMQQPDYARAMDYLSEMQIKTRRVFVEVM